MTTLAKTEIFDCNNPKVDNLVRNEVLLCVSGLVAEILAKNEDMEFYHLLATDNYLDALEDNLDSDDLATIRDEYEIADLDELEEGDLVDIANQYNIDPYVEEIFEHWAVSGFLADRLIDAGETVEKDFFGVNVWARTTTGQSITLDYVICKIVTDIHKECEKIMNG